MKPVTQLTSNNIVALAGSGDTVWLATERGFNYRVLSNASKVWNGFESGDLMQRFWGMSYGNGGAAALLNGDSDSIGFWHYNHNTGTQRQKYLLFPRSVRGDDGTLAFPVGGVMFAEGSFWAPFNHGGIVRYDPANNTVHAIRPNGDKEVLPQELPPVNSDQNIKNTTIVSSLNDFGNGGILVTTPSLLWVYYSNRETGSKWDTLLTNQSVTLTPPPGGGAAEFDKFVAAFIVRKNNDNALYSIISVKSGGKSDTALYSLSIPVSGLSSPPAASRWNRAIAGNTFSGIYPADAGHIFIYSESGNEVRIYADTLAAGSERDNHLALKMTPQDFRNALASGGGENPNPKINDLLYLPNPAGGGRLFAATEAGLYISNSVMLDQSSPALGSFTLDRYVRPVSSGEAYALPGIMRAWEDGRYDRSVFVYKLKKKGSVTISVYDYNMGLVTTVVKGRPRAAAPDGGRSTVAAEDFWDGTNRGGKRVWPGVYYFKITSTGGERFFGKVVIAK